MARSRRGRRGRHHQGSEPMNRHPTDRLAPTAHEVVRRPDEPATGRRYRATDKYLSSHNNSPVICASCGKRVARKGRIQRYCSARCRDRGRGRSRKALLGQGTGAPATPHKSASNINALHGARPRPSPYTNAPLNILGGGSFRWPDTPRLDARIYGQGYVKIAIAAGELEVPIELENIRRSEIGAAP
jgi:hypothetical protein